MSVLTIEALEQAMDELWALVPPRSPNTITMRVDVARWIRDSIKQQRRIEQMRVHPMLRHLTRRQFNRALRSQPIPYPQREEHNR